MNKEEKFCSKRKAFKPLNRVWRLKNRMLQLVGMSSLLFLSCDSNNAKQKEPSVTPSLLEEKDPKQSMEVAGAYHPECPGSVGENAIPDGYCDPNAEVLAAESKKIEAAKLESLKQLKDKLQYVKTSPKRRNTKNRKTQTKKLI